MRDFAGRRSRIGEISSFETNLRARASNAGVPGARSGERQIRRLDIVEGNSVKRQDQCRGYTRPRS